MFQLSYKREQTGFQNNLVFFENKKEAKLGITKPPCGHMTQVNKDKMCSFNVIFYFEIILIKSLSTVQACVRSVNASATRSGPPRVHAQAKGWRMRRCGVKRDEQRDAQAIHPGSVTAGRGLFDEADR